MANTRKKYTLPLIPVRGLVIFPEMVLHFDVARKASVAALSAAMESEERLVFLTAQKDISVEMPRENDIYHIGCIAKVKQLLKLPGGNIRVLVEGIKRAELLGIDFESNEFLASVVKVLPEQKMECYEKDYDALVMRINALLKKISDISGQINIDVINNLSLKNDPGRMADTIAANVFVKVDDRQEILEETDIGERVYRVSEILEDEAGVYEIEERIAKLTKQQVDKNQKDYLLREQLKAIRTELGEEGSEEDEYLKKLAESGLSGEEKKTVEKEIKKLREVPSSSPEYYILCQWLDTVFSLPWKDEEINEPDINKAEEILERDHYGLSDVKERIIEYLAVRKLAGNSKGTILCLFGPPGVGKTSIAKSVAEATGRPYVRMSLGGVRDEAEIRGHRKTYVGAMPGRIISAVARAKSKNALILLDEIDKLGSDFKGDPASAMLEVLDSAQNNAFRDHYLELPYDLSKIMFVTTANSLDTIPPALLDRLEVIELSGYTDEEKQKIAEGYLVPRQMKENGLKKSEIRFGEGVIAEIIECYTAEAGVRNLERTIGTVMRKAATKIVKGEKKSVTVTKKNIEDFLGPLKYEKDLVEKKNPPGVVTGLAWTRVGGVTLTVEVLAMDGTGKLELTGSLGDVMKESARAAVSYIRSKAPDFGVAPDFYKKKDIHIHFPEGATPKDGPSAGITMATAILSALKGVSALPDVAMTGEITLSGRVLPIGGLKEKMLAAYRAGAKTVIIPDKNKKDLVKIDDAVKEKITVIPVKTVDEVFSYALGEKRTDMKMVCGHKSAGRLRCEGEKI